MPAPSDVLSKALVQTQLLGPSFQAHGNSSSHVYEAEPLTETTDPHQAPQ